MGMGPGGRGVQWAEQRATDRGERKMEMRKIFSRGRFDGRTDQSQAPLSPWFRRRTRTNENAQPSRPPGLFDVKNGLPKNGFEKGMDDAGAHVNVRDALSDVASAARELVVANHPVQTAPASPSLTV